MRHESHPQRLAGSPSRGDPADARRDRRHALLIRRIRAVVPEHVQRKVPDALDHALETIRHASVTSTALSVATSAASASGWHDVSIDSTRVDVWLWAVRIYKTRSAATAGCRGGHVRVNRGAAKASTQVKIGDRVEAFVERERILEVSAVIDKRVGAAVAAKCLVDHSPPAPVKKRQPRVAVRERGTGRPTKRERRDLERFTRP
jgi:ribosome-associated heat shock protein Hsp15